MYDKILLVVASVCLLATAVQYPLSTTFPLGGDAAAHIATVQNILTNPLSTLEKISHSWYPVSYFLFSINAINPFVYWPIAFSWWMAFGQIAIGAALGLLLYRMSGRLAAALGISIWAMTPITMTSFFEDGTMAQLWSLPWILLFFERMLAKSYRGMAICCILTLFSHPITALVLIVTMLTALPHLWNAGKSASSDQKRIQRIVLGCAVASVGIAAFFLYARSNIFRISFVPESSRYSRELFHGFFFPWLLASIIGWPIISQVHRKNRIFLAVLGSFVFISFFLAINDQLGIGFWTNRLNSYLLLSVTIGAAIGASYLLNQLRMPFASSSIALLLILGFSGTTFHDNRNIYKRYESPSTYARIHPQELDAIAWMRDHIEPNSTILSSEHTRNYEWIPVLSNRDWIPTKEADLYSSEIHTTVNNPFIVFFTRQEEVPLVILENPSVYRPEFQNSSAAIYRIKL